MMEQVHGLHKTKVDTHTPMALTVHLLIVHMWLTDWLRTQLRYVPVPWRVCLVLRGCLGRCFVSSGIHMNARIDSFLAEYCTVARGSMLVPSTCSGFDVVADPCKCRRVWPRVPYKYHSIFAKLTQSFCQETKQSRKRQTSVWHRIFCSVPLRSCWKILLTFNRSC